MAELIFNGEVVDVTTGHYCTICNKLCTFIDYGITCSCDTIKKMQFTHEEYYPRCWIGVNITIQRNE